MSFTPGPDPEDTGRAPAGNWRRMHRGWAAQPKRRHRVWLAAWWHLRSYRRKFKVDADLVWVYPCWFTDENTFGRRHYHIGHMPKTRKLFDPARATPQPGTLFLGVFAVRGGFELRTFETRPANCRPVRPTVSAALNAYQTECDSATRTGAEQYNLT